MFEDRESAGEQLADALEEHGLSDVDLVVAAPRGGMPIGRVVADALEVPLDIVTGKKLTAPGHSDLSIGAVSAEGVVWMNDDLIRRIGVSESYVQNEGEESRRAAEVKRDAYREVKAAEPVEGRHVLVVDDGLATGATMNACVLDLQERGAGTVGVGLPVGDPRGIDSLEGAVDYVVAVRSPSDFEAVSHYYDDFRQIPDQEAMSYLAF